MYKDVNNTKEIHRYIESLAIHTGTPSVHWEDNTSCIYVVEFKIINTKVKHIDITVCFLQEKIDNSLSFQNMISLVLR